MRVGVNEVVIGVLLCTIALLGMRTSQTLLASRSFPGNPVANSTAAAAAASGPRASSKADDVLESIGTQLNLPGGGTKGVGLPAPHKPQEQFHDRHPRKKDLNWYVAPSSLAMDVCCCIP